MLFTSGLLCLMEFSKPVGKSGKKSNKIAASPLPQTTILGSVKPNWAGGGACVGQALTATLTHRECLVEEGLENHCEGLLLIVLAGGQETFPAFLKKGAEMCTEEHRKPQPAPWSNQGVLSSPSVTITITRCSELKAIRKLPLVSPFRPFEELNQVFIFF